MKIADYELGDALGKGGMGTVYRARHLPTGQIVAIKVLKAETFANPFLRKRFQQECAAAVRLSSPHIVRGLDFGIENDLAFLVMELIDGPSLAEHLREYGAMHWADGLLLARELAEGLQLAHDNQLLHRDVKPENVLLDQDGTAKLADLGLIKDLATEEVLTRPGTWIGTIAYMAPEQFGDTANADVRCDVYGLAATLYHALTGQPPFMGKGNLTILGKKHQNDFTPPGQLVAIPVGVDRVICAALDGVADRRPATIREFATRLESGSKETVVTALPPLPDPSERRKDLRYPSSLPCMCKVVLGGEQFWRGEIQDLSRSGIRLRVPRRFEANTLLELEVVLRPTAEVTSLVVKVCWTKSLVGGKWDIGCAFNTDLTVAEMDPLLDKPSTIVTEPDEMPE